MTGFVHKSKCPECHRMIVERNDGTLRVHSHEGERCPGSEKKP